MNRVLELPTLGRLVELFCYEPSSGIVTRRVKTANSTKRGEVVGTLCADGYLRAMVDGKRYYLHRLIGVMLWGSIPGGSEVDHINGLCADNRAENLRLCSRVENTRNRKRPSNNKSGVIGVYWDVKVGKWGSRVCNKHIGFFETVEEAGEASRLARASLGFSGRHGENPGRGL